MTLTLPNHTGMVTSRRVDRSRGGHGVTWNDERLRPRTVQTAAGHQVGSVFSSLKTAGLGSAMFAAKAKFTLFNRSWPNEHRPHADQGRQHRAGRGRPARPGDHLASPHVPAHLAARRRRSRPRLDVAGVPARRSASPTTWSAACSPPSPRRAESREHTLVVVTADHGGLGPGHSDPRKFADYRMPFLVWGPGVPAGADLYALNPTYADPGSLRVGYGTAQQPVRNGDVGNLVLDVLGLPADPPQRARLRPGPRGLRPLVRWLRRDAVPSRNLATGQRTCTGFRDRRQRAFLDQRGSRLPRPQLAAQRPRVVAAAEQALGLLHHHRREPAGTGAAEVAVAEPVAGLVVDHEVAVVAQALAARRSTTVRRTSSASG